MAEAGIGPHEVDHVNAHGLATPGSDIWEAKGLAEIFGRFSPPVPVFAGKSYVGNLGAAGSTTELAFSVLGLHHGLVPTSLNFEEPDPECPVAVLTGSPRSLGRPY